MLDENYLESPLGVNGQTQYIKPPEHLCLMNKLLILKFVLVRVST